jgi:hypothetical protein
MANTCTTGNPSFIIAWGELMLRLLAMLLIMDALVTA